MRLPQRRPSGSFRRLAGWLHLALAGAVATGCAGAAQRTGEHSAGPSLDALHYRFKLDQSLSRMEVTLCFEGRPPPTLACGHRVGVDYISDLRAVSQDGAVLGPLQRSGGRMRLSGLPPDACVRFDVDLDGLASDYVNFSAGRVGDGMVTRISTWLWRPPRRPAGLRADARFELPAGVQLSVPWEPELDGSYRLSASAFAFDAYAVFGRFEQERVEVPGGLIELAVLPGLAPQTRGHLRAWVEAQAKAAAQLDGRFPVERLLLVVIPSRPASSPVGFARVTRGGGVSIAALVRRDAQLDDLLRDWVLVHEFTHLRHPFVSRGDAWLSEGLATYYQEVLRVRAGLRSAEQAFARLHRGVRQGRFPAGSSLTSESAAMYRTGNFASVYWGGAAFALLADVELRRRSQGRLSLDHVLREIGDCCAGASRAWPARKLLERMDEVAGLEVFAPLAQRYAQQGGVPQLDSSYADLGIEIQGARVRFEEAELSWARDAIMAPVLLENH